MGRDEIQLHSRASQAEAQGYSQRASGCTVSSGNVSADPEAGLKLPTSFDRRVRGWAISVLHEEHVVCECEKHGWLQDRADPHARERALDISRWDPPPGSTSEQGLAELLEVLDSIGETNPHLTISSEARLPCRLIGSTSRLLIAI